MNSYTGRGEGFAWCGRGRKSTFQYTQKPRRSHMFWRENILFCFFSLLPYFLTSSCITRDGLVVQKCLKQQGFLISEFIPIQKIHWTAHLKQCSHRKGPNSAPALCGDGVPANARSATAWKLGRLASHVDAWLLVPQLTHGVDLNVEGWLLCWYEYEYEVLLACISHI